MVKRRVGGLVQAYVFYYLCCFYCIFTLDWMDGIIMNSQNIAIWIAIANANRNVELEGDYTLLYILIMIVTIVAAIIWILWTK